MLTRNVAGEVARKNVQVNAVGTNFMDFPEFLEATGAKDPAVREMFEKQVPLRRLGRMDEFAAFCAPFLDGTSTFTTGQYVSYAGGWV
jgi:3-oxoacyl-[acyl-carrier protein] reductase